MVMNTAEQILVVILAAALAVFLTLAIVIAVQTIKLMKMLQEIALKAQNIAGTAEEISQSVRDTVHGLSVLRLIQSVIDIVKKRQNK